MVTDTVGALQIKLHLAMHASPITRVPFFCKDKSLTSGTIYTCLQGILFPTVATTSQFLLSGHSQIFHPLGQLLHVDLPHDLELIIKQVPLSW